MLTIKILITCVIVPIALRLFYVFPNACPTRKGKGYTPTTDRVGWRYQALSKLSRNCNMFQQAITIRVKLTDGQILSYLQIK